MVHEMARGSVIVDLAAETGGNCELSRPGENIDVGGVTVIGVKNLPSSMPLHASFLYSRNIAEFLTLLVKDGVFAPDFDDEIVAGTCVTHGGEVRHEPDPRPARRREHMNGGDILSLITVFVLSAFVGFEVIAKVPSTLHTPLMSGTNAIHGVVLVGAMLILGTASGTTQMVLGFVAVVLATLNVVGGFVVTDRMLEMFKVRQPSKGLERVERRRRAAGRRGRPEVSLGTGIRLADLIAAICFILALRGLTSPKTARRGNLIGAAGMALAIGITFATNGLTHFLLIVGAMAIGAVVAVPAARLVKMTAMPQMVAAFNGVGGGAAALIALATFLRAPIGSLAVYQVVEVLFGVVDRLCLVRRELYRLREAAGAHDRQAGHLPRPAAGERHHRRRHPRRSGSPRASARTAG